MTRPTGAVAAPSAELIEELVTANRIIFDQKVVDGFGHISVRSVGERPATDIAVAAQTGEEPLDHRMRDRAALGVRQ